MRKRGDSNSEITIHSYINTHTNTGKKKKALPFIKLPSNISQIVRIYHKIETKLIGIKTRSLLKT